MPFPFTFDFSVPGFPSPFVPRPKDPLAPPSLNSKLNQEGRPHQAPVDRQYHSQGPLYGTRPGPSPVPAYPSSYPSSYPIQIPVAAGTRRISRADLPKINRPRPSPSLSPSPAPLSRKRGWEPDTSPSRSTTSLTLASTSGYLDTPAKYRQMAAVSEVQDDINTSDQVHLYNDNRHAEDEMPPLKKRRGIAGSIVSTAVSAALIGTAVGLTVYRLWRDRGKEARIEAAEHEVPQLPDPSTQPPPPPYEENDWKPLSQPAAIQVASRNPATPKSIARKRRSAAVAKRPIVYHSSRRSRPTPVTSPAPVQPEFDFGREEADEERVQSVVEDKMDWIGDKLSMLIEQGKRALNTEVVVMSDAKEDEVDDGSGAWEEDEDDFGGHQGQSGSKPPSRAGSIKRGKKPRNIVPPPSSGAGLGLYGVNAASSSSLSISPHRSVYGNGYPAYTPSLPSTSTTYVSATPGFAPSSLPRAFASGSPGRAHVRGLSYESALPSSFSVGQEDPAEWESPELRESMELARARLLARRAGA